MRTLKITEYKKAIDEAFSSNMANPAVAFTEEKGFEAISGIHIQNGYDVVWHQAAYYVGNGGGRRSLSKQNAAFAEVCEAINQNRDLNSQP